MGRTKIIAITACIHCPYYDGYAEEGRSYCLADETYPEITGCDPSESIPDFCPLDDYPDD